jgi:Zn-dependent M28 family amino/carboxypeptidase
MPSRHRRPVALAGGVLLLVACGSSTASPTGEQVNAALGAITAQGVLGEIKALSDDSMEGRAPGSAAEPKVLKYISGQFQTIGLQPGNPDGSWLQNVALMGYTSKPTASLTVGGKTMPLKFPDDYVATSRHEQLEVDVDNSDIVFVGYGVVAPEYNWDDYKGIDVKGKTIVMLVNDPPVRSASDTSVLDPAVFGGTRMTYYGRWTYKYEIASTKGAAAAIVVHQTAPAGYGWDVVRNSWSGENMDIRRADGNKDRVPVEAWITYDKAKQLFKAAGKDFDVLERAARERDFKPVDLHATATFHLQNSVRQVESHNVVGKLVGSDPTLRDEYVVYTAHWDHLGRDTTLKGDQIFNGAIDNASGVAGILEEAKAFRALATPPRRSILFIALTAEEKGLLGARYYVANPLYPLDKTLGDFNIDGLNQWGRTADLTVIGRGNTTLEDLLAQVAVSHGRSLSPDAEPEKGFYYRADHFEFAKAGVPAMFLDNGIHYIGKPDDYSKTKRDEYTDKDYHQPSDQVKPDWDLSGAVEDLGLLFRVGVQVSGDSIWPSWKPGTEFKAVRDKMLGGH